MKPHTETPLTALMRTLTFWHEEFYVFKAKSMSKEFLAWLKLL
jgi:hypothetical protein